MTSLIALPLLLILAQPAPVGQAESPAPPTEEIRIDRGLQVIVHPDRVRLQYDLGLSPAAATAMLKRHARDVPADENRRALMEAFRDLVLPEIQRRCRVTANGAPLEFRAGESRLFPKHYVQLTCIFEAPLPAGGDTIRLQLVDGSFRGYDGNHLIALKTDDGVQLQSSTVPLILARVPHESLSSDSAAQREAARRAEAVVVRPRDPDAAPGETPADLREKTPDVQEPAMIPAARANRPVPLIMWGGGFCAGLLALILVWWLRARRAV